MMRIRMTSRICVALVILALALPAIEQKVLPFFSKNLSVSGKK